VKAETIVCSNCGATLTGALSSEDLAERKTCANCGSSSRSYHEFIAESVMVRDGLGMKAKRPDKKRPHIETKDGPEHSRSRDKLVHRVQIFDRDNDRYVERVTDYESGEVIRKCEELLSKHLGHGSDKKNTSALLLLI
jgi:Zn ribbon nucleic-acid-binding protein